jgi:hypothetical protein
MTYVNTGVSADGSSMGVDLECNKDRVDLSREAPGVDLNAIEARGVSPPPKTKTSRRMHSMHIFQKKAGVAMAGTDNLMEASPDPTQTPWFPPDTPKIFPDPQIPLRYLHDTP